MIQIWTLFWSLGLRWPSQHNSRPRTFKPYPAQQLRLRVTVSGERLAHITLACAITKTQVTKVALMSPKRVCYPGCCLEVAPPPPDFYFDSIAFLSS